MFLSLIGTRQCGERLRVVLDIVSKKLDKIINYNEIIKKI